MLSLKRKSTEVEEEEEISDDQIDNDKAETLEPALTNHNDEIAEEKREKKIKNLRVQFDKVNVFYFERQPGFTCIPNTGTNTIGMSLNHVDSEQYTLEEYLNHKRLHHLSLMEKDENLRELLKKNLNEKKQSTSIICDETSSSSSSSSSITTTIVTTNVNNFNLDQELANLSDINIELPVNSELFCPLLTQNERVRLLKQHKAYAKNQLDISNEQKEISLVRKSREQCGCTCKNGACDTDACSCKLNGICCQLDKMKFPCACTIKKCKNPNGLKRFDMRSVQNHYMQILYPEQQLQQQPVVDSTTIADGNTNKKKCGRKPKRKRRKISKPNDDDVDNCSMFSPNEIVMEKVEVTNENRCQDLVPYDPFDLFKIVKSQFLCY